MAIMKKADSVIIRGKFIGICISGFDLFRFVDFAFFAMSKIRIPVIPPEIVPPIPKINAKLAIL